MITFVSGVLVIASFFLPDFESLQLPATARNLTIFLPLFILMGIALIAQWFLWISMIVATIMQRRFVWLAVVLFGLSWGAAVFLYFGYKPKSALAPLRKPRAEAT
jgi:hypothetical protein